MWGLLFALEGRAAEPAWELAPVEVIGERESLFRVPGSGYRVDGEVLEAFQIGDVNRLLERVPGVYFREEDGYGLIANISLRGVDTARSAKLTLMEDGVPTAPAPYSAPAAYYTPNVGRMSTVEVLKGTSQVRFGPHTTGGVINYISTPFPGSRAGQLRLSVGTDTDLRFQGWAGDRREALGGMVDFLAEVVHRETDGFRSIGAAPGYAGSDETGFERTEGMLKLGWSSDDGRQRLAFKIGATDLRADISYLGLNDADFKRTPYRRYAATREDVLDANHSRSLLRYGLKLGPDWKLTLLGYYNTFHRNWYKLNDIRDLDLDGDGRVEGEDGGDPVRMNLSAAVAGDAGGAGLEALKGERAAHFRVRANNRDYYLAGAEITLKGTVERGEWTHTPTAGIRVHSDRVRRLQWHDRYAQDAGGAWAEPIRSALGSDGNRRQHTLATALFLEDEISSGPWIFRPGMRMEFLDLTYEAYTTDGTNERIDKRTQSMEVLSAGFATKYQLKEDQAVFFNLYRGFSVPDPRSAIRGGINEETSNSAELGFRHRNPESGLSAELVGFYTHYKDLIVIDNIGSGAAGTDTNQPVTENVGEVDSYGIELLLNDTLYTSADGNWTVPVSLAATWTVAELDGPSRSTDPGSIFSGGRDGSALPYIPEFQVNLSLGLQGDTWSTGLSASWRDRTFSTATESTGGVNPLTGEPDARYGRIDSVFLLDWNLHYQLTENLRVFATVKNILDEVHLVSRHPHGPRAGAPRQVSAGMVLAF